MKKEHIAVMEKVLQHVTKDVEQLKAESQQEDESDYFSFLTFA